MMQSSGNFLKNGRSLHICLYSKTSLCGHLSKVDTSILWTLAGPPELFLLEMNLYNVDTSLFWTVDTFFWSQSHQKPLESGQSPDFMAFLKLSQNSKTIIQNTNI